MNQLYDLNQLIIKKPLSFSSKLQRQSSLQPSTPISLSSTTTPLVQTIPNLKRPRKFSVLVPKKSISTVKLSKPPTTISYEDPPNLPRKGPHNERYYWKKRKAGNLPLLIIVFEGVLGNYGKSSFWTNEKSQFSLRPDFFPSISNLRSQFYIVIISTYSKAATKELISLIEKDQNLIDAVYMKRRRASQTRYTHDVSIILEEFRITNKTSVLALSAIGIDTSEILLRKESDLVCEKSASSKKKFLTYFAPSCDKDCPVTILIPHFGFFQKFQSLVGLVKFVLEFKRIDKNFFIAFEKFCGGIKLETVFEEKQGNESSILMPSRRFLFFIKEGEGVDKRCFSDFLIRRPMRRKL